MKRLVIPILMVCLPACQVTYAEPQQLDSHTWDGVARIVAVGDIHGDYEHYIETLEIAGLVNRRGKWAGGSTHLVQLGDIPDRGPDTRRIMAHIDKLAEQARKAGGYVHRLIGNHEAMNAYGDLRYVTAAEFEEFADRRSDDLRERYFQLVMQDLEQNDPEAFAALPGDYRETWDAEHPPGFVEHQQAWNTAWNPDGEYARRIQELSVAVKINGVVFVHGGISDLYANIPLDELTQRAHAELANFSYEPPGVLTDTCGPLWFRGVAGSEPQAAPDTVASILERLSADRMVIGHTPTPAVIWPRYDGRVIQADTGISASYGGFPAFLEITPEGLFAGYPGGKVALPENDAERAAYLDELAEMDPTNSMLQRVRPRLLPGEDAVSDAAGQGESETGTDEMPAEEEPNFCLREGSAPAG